jgi:cell division transport system permease protein
MRALEYAFREAASSLWRGRGSSVFAICAIALASVVLGVLLLATSNAERLLHEWASAAEFSVYLQDGATSEQRGMIEHTIDSSGLAVSREYVSKPQALGRFQHDFADLASLAANLQANPFPASVEVQLKSGLALNTSVDTLVADLTRAPGVADVRYDRQWISRMTVGLTAVQRVGGVVVLIMLGAAGLTVATVVRLALHARAEEIEIMLLVGSPYSFIRGPFIAEGVMQGGLGALLAIGLLWLGFVLMQVNWGSAVAAVAGPESLRFLSASLCGALVAGGMIVGGIGGFAAARTAS